MSESKEFTSRTQIKKEAEKVQKLGEQLCTLSASQLNSIDIPEPLKKAVLNYKTIKSNIAAKRQRQFIGALMRDIDPEPVIQAFKRIQQGIPLMNQQANGQSNNDVYDRQTEMKSFCEELLSGDKALIASMVDRDPSINRQKLNQLIRNARKATENQTKSRKSAEKKLLSFLLDETGL